MRIYFDRETTSRL